MLWAIFGLFLYYLVVLCERAAIGLSPHDLEVLRRAKPAGFQQVIHLADSLKPTLTGLWLGRLGLKIGVCAVAAACLLGLLSQRDPNQFWEETNLSAQQLAVVSLLLLAMLLTLNFWAIDRKAKVRKPIPVLRALAVLVQFLEKIWGKFFPKNIATKSAQILENEQLASDTDAQPSPETQEREMLKSIVNFADVMVKQVMQPRQQVTWLGQDLSFSEVLAVVRETGFSRFPICGEDLDDVKGILYVKDLVPHLDQADDFAWQSLARAEFLQVPETQRISQLLANFKKGKKHLAVVVDEFGSLAGIATLEDVLEEVTGDIRDEFDEENEANFTRLDANTFEFEGRTPLPDVCRFAGLDAATFDEACSDADTLAGLVLELFGDIPETGAEIVWEGFVFTVLAADSRRVERVRVQVPDAV